MPVNPWIILAAVLAFIGTAIGGFSFGRSYEAGEQAKVQHEQAVAYAAEIVRQQGDVDSLSDELEKLRARKQGKDRIITKEVIRYEQVTKPDERCTLPAAWRVLHDAAATGEPATEAAGLADAGAGAVTDAAAIATVADNYADCRGYAEQVKGWQGYYRELTKGQK